MSQSDDAASRVNGVTIEQWEDAHPSWVVVGHHPIVTSAVDGKILEKIVVQVLHLITGEQIEGVGLDLDMALALVSLCIDEQG